MDQSIYWFSFIMGLVAFAGIVLAARNVVRSTPTALDKLFRKMEYRDEKVEKDTEKINAKLDELSKEVLQLRFKLEAYMDK